MYDCKLAITVLYRCIELVGIPFQLVQSVSAVSLSLYTIIIILAHDSEAKPAFMHFMVSAYHWDIPYHGREMILLPCPYCTMLTDVT